MGIDDPGLQADDETLIRELLDSDHEWLDGITYEHLAEHTWARLNVGPGTRPYVDTTPDTDDGRLHLGALEFHAGAETPDGDPATARRFFTCMPRAAPGRPPDWNFWRAIVGSTCR